MKRVNDIKIAPHFSLREFECRCCGAVKISPDLVDLLERLRDVLARPIVVTSGYRCAAHNEEVGGATKSYHLLGRAADIACAPDEQRSAASAARELGFAEVICGGDKCYLHLAK